MGRICLTWTNRVEGCLDCRVIPCQRVSIYGAWHFASYIAYQSSGSLIKFRIDTANVLRFSIWESVFRMPYFRISAFSPILGESLGIGIDFQSISGFMSQRWWSLRCNLKISLVPTRLLIHRNSLKPRWCISRGKNRFQIEQNEPLKSRSGFRAHLYMGVRRVKWT